VVKIVKLETKQAVEDFIRGCTFLGTGGGGHPKEGREWLIEDLERGMKLEFNNVDSISDKGWTVCPFLMGSIAPEAEETKQKKETLGLTKEIISRPLVKAIEELEEYKGINIEGIVPIEIGGGNTPGPLDAAAHLGKKLVDGDYAGRAIPEIEQITPVLFDKKLYPITCVDVYGDTSIIKEGINPSMVERIGKFISDSSFGLNGDAGILLKGKEVKEILIRGTLSKALKIGQTIRQARESKEEPIKKVIDEIGGWLLFEGKAVDKEWEDKEGYMWGEHKIKGSKEFEGHEFKIWFKNENHISWLDGKPWVTSPDIIEIVDSHTSEPIVNTDLSKGAKVAVIGMKGQEKFRTVKGLELLGPKHFGFDIEYTPIEEKVK
jgi:hypothetical protein